jgi:OmpA-OmpF porin, OOP family
MTIRILTFTSFAALVAAAFFLPATAKAEDGYGFWPKWEGAYVAGQAGGSFPTDDELDNGGSYALALGYQFNANVRTELEGSYRNNDFDSGVTDADADTWGLMLNAFYDFKNESRLTPYVGGGIGWAHSNLDGDVGGIGFDDSDDAFAYQLGAGLAFNVTDGLALTADYRWFDTTDFTYDFAGVEGDADYSAHEIRAGFRYVF